MYIIYKNDNGKNIVITPSPNCGLTIEQIAEKDVPKGKQYIITDTIPVDIAELKQRKWQEIKVMRDIKEQSGFPFMGKIAESDQVSVTRINTASQMALFAKQSNQPFSIPWAMQDGTVINLNADQMISMPVAMGTYVNSLHVKARAYKEQIFNAVTEQEVEAVAWVG